MPRTARSAVLNQIAQEERANDRGQLKKLEGAIKKGKLKVPTMKHEGDKIMYSLDLCAKQFPKLPIPIPHLTMMVSGLGAVPRADSKRVEEVGKRVSSKRRRMREKYGRDIISIRGEKAVRATVDEEDAAMNVGMAANQRAIRAVQTSQEVGQLFDINNIPVTDANRERIEWYLKSNKALERLNKQLPALPANAGKSEK